MRIFLGLACSLFVLLIAQTGRAADLFLVHARVYPSPEAAPLENATIVLQNKRIASVSLPASANPVEIARGATVIDCAGMSVTAGLWNSHVHILPVNLLHSQQKTNAQLSSALQEMFTRWGFTKVFDLASTLANTNAIRTRVAAGSVSGPLILTVGEPFFPLHGIPVYVRAYLEQNDIAFPNDPTTASAVQRVRQQIHNGVNGIKIFAGSIQQDDVLIMPLDRAKAIVEEAHRLGRPVFAHPSNRAGVEVALNSGVDVLAHVTSDDQP